MNRGNKEDVVVVVSVSKILNVVSLAQAQFSTWRTQRRLNALMNICIQISTNCFPKPFVDIPFYMTKLLKRLKIAIIFPVTQPKLFDKVIMLAIGCSCFLLNYWAYTNFS